MVTFSEQKTYALFSNPANRKLISQIEQTGARVFQFAPVKTTKKKISAEDEKLLRHLSAFDWIIFPDVYAVEYFLEALLEMEIDLFLLDSINVLAVGEAVADRLRFVQLHADIIPGSVEIETVCSVLLQFLGSDNLNLLKCLIPKELTFKSELKDYLTGKGANVSEMTVYQISTEDRNKPFNLKALLKGGAIDEFIFTQTEDIISAKHYISPEKLTEAYSETKISATNDITVQSLRENNLNPSFFQVKRG